MVKKQPKRVLICGSRWWTDIWPILRELKQLPKSVTTVIHGACRGADRLAGEVAHGLDFKVTSVPANWRKYGKAAGPIRNQKMLDMLSKGDLVISFHEDLEKSKGTKHMLRIAQEAGFETKKFSA